METMARIADRVQTQLFHHRKQTRIGIEQALIRKQEESSKTH
jgi:hypothetical protein